MIMIWQNNHLHLHGYAAPPTPPPPPHHHHDHLQAALPHSLHDQPPLAPPGRWLASQASQVPP